jgi:hypothetical protein
MYAAVSEGKLWADVPARYALRDPSDSSFKRLHSEPAQLIRFGQY